MPAQHCASTRGETAGDAHDRIVSCPRCGEQFPLTDAFAVELASHVLAAKEPALREQLVKELQGRFGSELQQRKEKRYYAQAWAQREQQIEKTRAILVGVVAELVRVGAELPSTTLGELPTADLAVLAAPEVPALPSAAQ